ncbi:protein of unknown function DUF4864 containing protein [Nitzschia inconspicua]|uniref:Uncharacterized protein n=1 Tax=Nitzschia inconspicua TaxID=303405 RepID=A0A9K3K5Q9_9STRA|nr:protein of unknown function DUF4864 containing protein [Nitzschia inconspicua]KAG7368877.1 protein of unknown function DUF4864 containing protein [Nitzschia inconspicua]
MTFQRLPGKKPTERRRYGTTKSDLPKTLLSLMMIVRILSFSQIFICRAFHLSPSTPPQEVIQQQLQALQQDDMTKVYQLASPNNKERTGDVTRFGQMVRSGPYRHLVQHHSSLVLLESTIGASQQFLVRIVPQDYAESGRIVEYWWSLSRCRGGEYEGSYMVDAVIPNQ